MRLKSFVPTLEGLEERTVPSSTALGWSAESAVAHSHSTVHAADVVPTIPVSYINFKPIDGARVVGQVNVKLTADTYTSTVPVTVRGNPGALTIRNAVYDSIQKPVGGRNGWSIEKVDNADGPQIKVNGYIDNTGKLIPISGVSATSKSAPDPSVAGSSGVTVGQLTTGTSWDIALGSSTIDGSVTVPVDATLTLVLNSTTVSVSLSQGEVIDQVANDLYNALVTAGVPDATINGNDVAFLTDPTGQEITNVTQSLGPQNPQVTPPYSWPDLNLGIAQRSIIS